MCDFKVFYGNTYFNGTELLKNGIRNLIELDYYKTGTNIGRENITVYGIEVIKTEHFKGKIRTEADNVDLLTKDEALIDKILHTLREQKVTPIGLKDVVQELV